MLLKLTAQTRERERESKRLRRFVKFVFSFVFVLSLFFTVHSSVYAATLRWVQVDKGVVSHAYRAGGMMVQKDKISANNQVYGTSMFDGAKWNDVGTPSPSQTVGDMFLDSRGIVYIGGKKTDDNKSYIFESTDGLNFTPVQLFIDNNNTGSYIWNFTEDKYGNVWAGEYTTHTVTTGGHLWRRRPSGTWTNVANWTAPEDHIHNVYYDPFRDALYVAIGDQDHGILKLPSNKINADGISSSDFSFILPTDPNGKGVQVTAMTSDSSYIYVGMDTHSPDTNTRSIARITDNGSTQTMEYVYTLPGCTVWNWAHVDDNGVIIFWGNGCTEFSCVSGQFFNKILASDDHGTTWQAVKDFGSTSRNLTGSNGSVGLPSYYATNWSGLYGFGNGSGVQPLRAAIGRVLPANQTFYVDGTNGVDWTNFGLTQARPVKTLNYLEMLDIQPGDTVSFIGTNTYSNPLLAGWSGNGTSNISFRGNTTSTFSGGNLANSPAVAETFESAKGSWNFTLNEAGGSITADTSIFHEGAQSAKVVRGASGTTSMALKNVVATNINEGNTMYVSYWFYYPVDQTTGSDQNMLRILDGSSFELRTVIKPPTASTLLNEIDLDEPQVGNRVIPSRKSITSGSWHKMYIEEYLHSTSGSFKMYVDNQLFLNVNGIKTITAGGKVSSIYFYPYENPITFYIDDFKFGKLPFDNRGAINTNDYNYLDFGNLKFGGNNGALISSNSNNINLHDSIFNSLTNDAIISSGSASLNYYYNTIFGSGRYGFNAATSATLKNNVVFNSTTNDVFVGAGATLTGNNNWFKDSAKGGTGTYTDAGSTTWSGAIPNFANSGTGDFHLLSTSPLINAGTAVAGFTSDFASTTRPQGSAPDIGAYEFILPDAPASLAQYRSDGTTTLTSGVYTNESTVVLKFNMSSSNSTDSLTPQVEIQPIGTNFTNAVTNSGSAVAYSGTTVSGTVTVTGLTTGITYHWQARINNSAGGGSWVSMGGNPDFGIDTTTPTNPSLSSPTGYTKDNTKPTLIFKKSTDSSSYISSYTVTLDSGKSRSFSSSGIPKNGNGSSDYVWKDDSSVKVEFLNENDSDSGNDEIHVYFKDLDKTDLSEGKHTWTVTSYDPASNSTYSSADFYIDKTSPSISDLAIANISIVQAGQNYNISILNRTPSFSGLATDSYQGSNVTNSDGSKDTFDKVSSGPQTIALTLKRQKDDKSWVDYLTQDYSLSNIQDTANDKKSTRFYITVPFPLIDGYYQSTIVLKDSAGNSYTQPVFYLSINNNLPWPLQKLFGGNLETKIIDQSTVPNNRQESNNACKTYTVKSGNSLWSISKILTGDGDKYKDIIEQNKDKYPSLANSNSITAGWELQINCQPGQTPQGNQPLSQNGYDVKIKVVDTNKKPVPGAKVTIHSKVQETTTDKNGIALFNSVEPGQHKILIAYANYSGEQSVNLTGDVKEFDLTIQVKQTNAFLNPQVLIVIGIMAFVILITVVLLIKARKNKV